MQRKKKNVNYSRLGDGPLAILISIHKELKREDGVEPTFSQVDILERIGDQVGEVLFQGNWRLTIFEFTFVKDHIREVLNGVQCANLHARSNFVGQEAKVFEFIDRGVVNCSSNAICNYHWWEGLPTSWWRCGIRISYLACLWEMTTSKYLSLRYANSINWKVILGDGKEKAD